MRNYKLICRKSVTGFSITLFLCAVLNGAVLNASDDFSGHAFNQYGLGLDNPFAEDFATDYQRFSRSKTTVQRLKESALHIDIEYQDETAGIFSPFHGVNSELNHKLNYTSNEYQTRMGYQMNYLIPEAAFKYSPNSYGFGKYYNYELGLAVPVKGLFSLETRYGWNKFDKQARNGGIKDYQDWSVGVSTTYKGVKLKVDYIDMNASDKSGECGRLFPCEGKTVFSIIKKF